MWLKDKASLLVTFIFLLTSGAHAAEYSITIENLSDGLYFKNIIIAAHSDEVDLFEPATRISERLEWLVECGEPKYYFELNEDAGFRGEDVPDPEEMVFNVFDTDEDSENDDEFWNVAAIDPRQTPALQLLGPKETSASIDLDAVDVENTFLTLFGRVMATNDGFVGLDAGALPTSPGEENFYDLYIWDAGSEKNSEILVLPNQCEVDCSAEAASLWDCTEGENCQASYIGLAECNHDKCTTGNNELLQECYAQICSSEMAAYSGCYDEFLVECEADQDEEIPAFLSITACMSHKDRCESEISDLAGCYDQEKACVNEMDAFSTCYGANFADCEEDQEKEPGNRQFASITACMNVKCTTENTAINNCFGNDDEISTDDDRCSHEAVSYSDCYELKYGECAADQKKDLADRKFKNGITECMDEKCNEQVTNFDICRSSVEACVRSSGDLQCTSENCLDQYENVANCLDFNKLTETKDCSNEPTGDGCCSDDNQTYWACLDVDLQCQDDIEDNACNLENNSMPDLPGLLYVPASPATGMVVSEQNSWALVHIHRGVMGDQDPDGGKSDLDSSLHRWDGPAARVVVKMK